MTIKKLIIYSVILLGIAVGALVFTLVDLSVSESTIQDAQRNRDLSLKLAEELQESSRSLTSSVRMFIVTGEERFAEEYMDILRIRSGEQPRPDDMEIAPGQLVSLDELMRQADYSEDELDLLRQSALLSDELTAIEVEAMNALRGLFPDDKGEYSLSGEPDKAIAIGLIFSRDYESYVEGIMAPITMFRHKLNERLDNTISLANESHTRSIRMVWIISLAIMGLFLLFLILVYVVIVRPILLCDAFAKQVARGNFDSTLDYKRNNEIGYLADSLRLMLRTMLDRINLKENIRYLSAVISSVDAGVIIKDENGLITDWNIGAECILGYSFEEILKHSSKYYANEEFHAEIDDIETRLRYGEHISHMEVVRKHKDGQLVDCSASYTPIFGDNGNFVGSVAIFHDITQKKLAEQKARKFAAIVSIADAGIIVKDKEGIVQEWNIGAENVLGYNADEMIGHSTKYYAPEESHADIDEITRRLNNGEHIAHLEVVRKHKDGRLIDCSASYTPIYGDDGSLTGSVAIFHDVTAEKNAVKKAKNMAAIVSAADAGIVVKDVECNILEWNSGAEKILGYKAEEIIGKHTKYYVPEESYEEIDQIKDRLLMGEHTSNVEVVRKHKDGRLIDCSATYTPVFDDNGKFTGSVAVFQDISKNKQVENALKEAARIAEEASKAKSSFLANMSHEIRTPMNGVMGFAELALDEDALSDTVRDYLTKIKSSAGSLLNIINDVLDISKIEAGAIELEKIPFSLHSLFHECEAISMPKSAEKGLNLYFYAEPVVGGRLVGDPTRLRQILLNLLSNAIKFTNCGIVKVTAGVDEKTDNTASIRFEVRDSGIGMEQEQIERIFAPFAQADGSTTRKYGGTGLGLSITKSFVELMGGTLHVDSTPGLGSKFTFTLTFETADELPSEDFHEKETLSRRNRPRFKGEVLVCEDNSINQEVIAKHLSKVGLSSVIVSDGQQCLEEVSKRMSVGNPFDLILMDIQMPIMDGLEATKHLLHMENEAPIIALTANAMSIDRESYLKQGMSDYLSKPFTTEELWECMARHLKSIDPAEAAPEPEEPRNDAPDDRGSILNEKKGIRNSADDEPLYRRMQKNFYKDNQNVISRLNEALRSGNTELAYRTAHTLKSTSGLIGAEKLSKIAHGLETALLNKKTDGASERINALESALSEVFAMLEPAASKIEPSKEAGSLDVGKAISLIEKVSVLLESGNPECIGFIDEIKAVLTPLGKSCGMLVIQIEDFDFDVALETIREMRISLDTAITKGN